MERVGWLSPYGPKNSNGGWPPVWKAGEAKTHAPLRPV